ncbi:MAG: hypothetical protein AB4290_11735 [Spirulina sp.]
MQSDGDTKRYKISVIADVPHSVLPFDPKRSLRTKLENPSHKSLSKDSVFATISSLSVAIAARFS